MSRRLFDVLEEIDARVKPAPHLLLFLDFDGTLVPIAAHPDLVHLPPLRTIALKSLGAVDTTTITIISGRERTDLQKRVGVPGLIYAGNHGLEISGPGFMFIEPTAIACRPALQALAAELAGRVGMTPGAFVEDKGLTLSVHYRQAPIDAAESIRQTVHAALANASHPFQLTAGDMVFDVRPRVNWTKGTAATWIRSQLAKPDALSIYVGDDATDEDAFAALPDGITVKVGGGPSETAAAFQVENTDEVWRFLDWLKMTLTRRVPAGVH